MIGPASSSAAMVRSSTAPNAQAQTMLDVLIGWRQRGGSRLDRDLDGLIDDPGAAIMDRAWPKMADNFLDVAHFPFVHLGTIGAWRRKRWTRHVSASVTYRLPCESESMLCGLRNCPT
jgi:phenylpropionate dioxygenase-like ring-hydroxylating dioxygenase large terminal subunit